MKLLFREVENRIKNISYDRSDVFEYTKGNDPGAWIDFDFFFKVDNFPFWLEARLNHEDQDGFFWESLDLTYDILNGNPNTSFKCPFTNKEVNLLSDIHCDLFDKKEMALLLQYLIKKLRLRLLLDSPVIFPLMVQAPFYQDGDQL